MSALNYHGLDRFTKNLSDMTHAVLSDDESDHENGTILGQRRYAIVLEEWCSDELKTWLRMIDLLACREKWDGRNVARPGNGRRLRVVSNRSKRGVAVSGLPENCYNPSWLKTLKGYERKQLNVAPAIDMTFKEEERTCVFQLCQFVLVRYVTFIGSQHNTFHSRRERPNPQLTLTPANSTTGSCTNLEGFLTNSQELLGIIVDKWNSHSFMFYAPEAIP